MWVQSPHQLWMLSGEYDIISKLGWLRDTYMYHSLIPHNTRDEIDVYDGIFVTACKITNSLSTHSSIAVSDLKVCIHIQWSVQDIVVVVVNLKVFEQNVLSSVSAQTQLQFK